MNTSFVDTFTSLNLPDIRSRIVEATARDVERVLSLDHLGPEHAPILFSLAAEPYLEEIAQLSAALTERRFGKIIQLYTPLYTTNECVNRCTYCGFSRELKIPRITLTVDQVLAEAEILHQEGFRHILLVSGESPRHMNLPYILDVVRPLHERFDSISIEINSMPTDDYRSLVAAGVDGLTLYQETYDPELYKKFHLAGPKRVFSYRLQTMERGGEAGFRSLGIGALLGLGDWRFEAVMVAMHGRYLTRRFWQSRIAVSFPRITPTPGEFKPDFPVSDVNLVHMICAMRLLLPDAELVISTREPARLRDRLIGLGITRMSAGSRTNPGGYSHPEAGGEQFEVEDPRSPAEIAAMLTARGYEPVWKDFDRNLLSSQ